MLVGLTGFVLVLALSVAVALIIFGVGRVISEKGKDTPEKYTTYACGEDLPAEKVAVNTEEFFLYAVYFMVFHILAFVLATTIARPTSALLPVFFAGATLISVAILSVRRKI